MINELIGRWTLSSAISTNDQIPVIENEPDPEGVSRWLNGTDVEVVKQSEPTSGLEFEITPDGRFTEQITGKANVMWFDAEGVLTEVTPFGGTVVSNDQGVYLIPDDVPNDARPIDGRYGKAILRLDDGDTKICDGLCLLNDHLVRTVNVVTDELYLNRVVIVYTRSS